MVDVLFINATEGVALNQEVNGTLLLATKLLQSGICADVLRFSQIDGYSKMCDYHKFISNIVKRILDIRPKCISFYTLWSTYHVMHRIAMEIKKNDPSIIIVMGGPQTSTSAEETLLVADYVDYISTGEGENVVVPFFKLLLSGNVEGLKDIPAIYYRVDGKIVHNTLDIPLCDLNSLPWWDKRLLTDSHGKAEKNIKSPTYYMPIDAGRGCPYNCTFCSTSMFWKRTYRLKSPQRIIDDILHFKNEYGIESFWFAHDAFTSDNRLADAVCDEIIARGIDIKWRCSSRIDCVTKDLILKMKKSGLQLIELGIETGSERMQKVINKRLNLNKAREMVKFLLEQGIQTHLFFMYGFPEETEQDLNETIEFMFDMLDQGVHAVRMNYCKFFPGTSITQNYIDKLVIDPKIKALSAQVFGYKEELDMIKANRPLFTCFYHLNTPVRDEYQHVDVLKYVYKTYPNSIRYLRKLYKGDNLQFYHDLVNKNPTIFAKDINDLIEDIKENSLTAVYNVLDGFDVPYKRQLKELMRYDYDRKILSEKTGDFVEKKTYGFSFLDLSRKRPIEQYGEAESDILFVKNGDITKVKMIDIR